MNTGEKHIQPTIPIHKGEISDTKFYRKLYPQKFSKTGIIWVTTLIILCVLGLIAYSRQLYYGLKVTGMRDYALWGIYISNFVFFVAVSLVGSLITAILRLSNVRWNTPITRIAEIIAVASITFAAIIIIVDMGRPDRFLNTLFYARIQSPITWDIMVISTYLIMSILFLYIPLIPDIAICRDNLTDIPKWQQKMYKILAWNWVDSKEQHQINKRLIKILSILIIPVALSIHTVTSWLFATTYRPGWDSTNFGPYFVSGAFMVGAAAVIVGMYVLRRYYHLKEFITDLHFDHMGKLLVLLSMIYLYFNVNEYMIPAYKMKLAEADHLIELFSGSYAPLFWLVQIVGLVIPVIVLLFRKGRQPIPMFIISLLVIVGAWFKRYLIVTPTLLHPFLPVHGVPETWNTYFPTWEEWSITIGSLAGALLIITFFFRYFPILPMVELQHEKNNQTAAS